MQLTLLLKHDERERLHLCASFFGADFFGYHVVAPFEIV